MPKIRKKTSKRVSLRQKYTNLKFVASHNRKMRKEARKLTKAGIKPRPSKKLQNVIPNSFPGKEQLINDMEMQAA